MAARCVSPSSAGMELSEAGAICLFALVAGSAFLFTSYGVASFPPITLVAIRLSLGSALLFLVHIGFAKRGERPKISWEASRILASVGVINTVLPYTLFAAAMSGGIGVGVAAAFSGAAPLLAVPLSVALLPGGTDARHLCSLRFLVCLTSGFLGVLLLAAYKEVFSRDHRLSSSTGLTFQLLGVFTKALASVLMERGNRILHAKGEHIPVITQAFLQAASGAAVAIVLAFALDCTRLTPSLLDPHGLAHEDGCFVLTHAGTRAWLSVLYLGVGSSCAVYMLQFFLLKRAGAVRQNLVDFLTPAIGVAEGALFKGEFIGLSPEGLALCGGGTFLILCGLTCLPKSPGGYMRSGTVVADGAERLL